MTTITENQHKTWKQTNNNIGTKQTETSQKYEKHIRTSI